MPNSYHLCSAISTTEAAPSLIMLELATVIDPSGSKTGKRLSIKSKLILEYSSSFSTVFDPLFVAVFTEHISFAKKFLSQAAAVLR